MRHALLLGLLLALAGCAGADRPLTTGEFYGFCWPQQVGYGCWDDNLCQDYRDYLEMEHASKAECLEGCNKMQTAKWRADAMHGCEGAIRNATDWCEKYCRRYFDNPHPEQGAQQ